jgi:hypothetical protein
VPVEIVLLILDGAGITAVVTIVLPLIETVAVVVIFRGLYFGSKVDFNWSPVNSHVPFIVVTSGSLSAEKVNINV